MRKPPAGSLAQRGFTLIEAIVVMTILAVLAGLSASSFVWLGQMGRIRAAAFDLVADLDFARSEAVKRNGDVVVAPVDGSWNNGWSVSVTVGGAVLRQRPAPGGQVAFDNPTTPATLTFDGGGRVSPANVATLQICPPTRGNLSGRTVRVDPSGLSRSSKTLCAAP
jgi:type IV fimbrial biogenesis protein FimT